MAKENVVVVRFTEPSKAYQALSVLKECDADGRIELQFHVDAALAVGERALSLAASGGAQATPKTKSCSSSRIRSSN